ncbi:MAG: formimidoylglutamate deiminase [Pseudomonadota bacterium]
MDFFAKSALLSRGWAQDVLLRTDDDGLLSEVRSNARPTRASLRLAGPVLPGMPNLHSHAFQRAMAGLAESAGKAPDSFWTWREVMYRFVTRLDPEQLGAIAAQLYLEMLKAGYTSVAEFHYLHHQPGGRPYDDLAEMANRIVRAAQQTGIGLTLLPALYAYGGFGGKQPARGQARFINGADRFLRLVQELKARHDNKPNMRIGIAPHSLRAVTKGLLSETLTGLNRMDDTAPVHIHIAEQTREVEECQEWSGMRPVTWLYNHFDVGQRWCLVHATHINRMEAWMVSNSRAVAGLCPTTEANLGDGIFPLGLYMRGEGSFGIGSDSHISVSPIEELRWLEYVQRLRREIRNVAVTDRQRHVGMRLWHDTVAGGAQALGQPVGGLKVGNRADFIVVDGSHPLLIGRDGATLVDSLVFSGNQNPITDVFVGGEQVITEGSHEREEAITRRFRRAINQLHA